MKKVIKVTYTVHHNNDTSACTVYFCSEGYAADLVAALSQNSIVSNILVEKVKIEADNKLTDKNSA